MLKVLFVCHGNICRSTMAQFVMEDLVRKAHREGEFVIDSAATSTEELGEPPHHGTVRKLREMGVPMHAHRARQVKRAEYDDWDLFVYMDAANERNLRRIFGGDPEGKCVKLLAFAEGAGVDAAAGRGACAAWPDAAASAAAPDVADPWYTGNFDATYRDVLAGCQGLLAWCGTRLAFVCRA